MNVEVVQRRLWEQSQQHRKQDQPQWIVTACNRVLSLYPIKAVWKAGCRETCTSGLGLGRGCNSPAHTTRIGLERKSLR